MLVKKHIIYGAIFSVLLFLIFPVRVGLIGALIILISTIIIDTDHYLYLLIKEKIWNLKKSVNYFKQARDERSKMIPKFSKNYYSAWCFLHGVELLILLFVLGFFVHRYFYFILIGVAFHLLLDLIEQIQLKGRIDKLSLIYDYFKYKKLKRI